MWYTHTLNNPKKQNYFFHSGLGRLTDMAKRMNIVHVNGRDYLEPYYPVGYVMMLASTLDPNKWYSGKWELTCLERSPMGVNPSSADSNYKTAGKQFGAKTHALVQSEIPEHVGHFRDMTGNSNKYIDKSKFDEYGTYGRGWNMERSGEMIPATLPYGGSQAHNNIHPVETLFFWKKVSL